MDRGSGLEKSLFVYCCCCRSADGGIINLQIIGNLFQSLFMGEGDVREQKIHPREDQGKRLKGKGEKKSTKHMSHAELAENAEKKKRIC